MQSPAASIHLGRTFRLTGRHGDFSTARAGREPCVRNRLRRHPRLGRPDEHGDRLVLSAAHPGAADESHRGGRHRRTPAARGIGRGWHTHGRGAGRAGDQRGHRLGGASLTNLLALYPRSILGVLLVFAGFTLAAAARDCRRGLDLVLVLLTTGGIVLLDTASGVLIGLGALLAVRAATRLAQRRRDTLRLAQPGSGDRAVDDARQALERPWTGDSQTLSAGGADRLPQLRQYPRAVAAACAPVPPSGWKHHVVVDHKRDGERQYERQRDARGEADNRRPRLWKPRGPKR
jgi:hypothetical protein